MNIGKQIKKYREIKGISQEELADKIFVTRQTISNWENDKNYPDIKSICLLCNFFDVSLDEFIKGDVEEMKKRIDESDLKEFKGLSKMYLFELIIILVSAYPLLKFFQIIGLVVWLMLIVVMLYTIVKIENLYQKNECQTYKEIVAFTEGKTLTEKEKIEENAKRPYQKIMLGILSVVIFVIVYIILEIVLG